MIEPFLINIYEMILNSNSFIEYKLRYSFNDVKNKNQNLINLNKNLTENNQQLTKENEINVKQLSSEYTELINAYSDEIISLKQKNYQNKEKIRNLNRINKLLFNKYTELSKKNELMKNKKRTNIIERMKFKSK